MKVINIGDENMRYVQSHTANDLPLLYEGLKAYCVALNTLDLTPLEEFLHEDFCYESQMVITPIQPKANFIDYISKKLVRIRQGLPDTKVWAEISAPNDPYPYVILAQGDKDNLIGVALATLKDGFLERIDLCIVPPPHSFERTGIYPGSGPI